MEHIKFHADLKLKFIFSNKDKDVSLFKKIRMLFAVIEHAIKYCVIKTDEMSEGKVIIPKNVDELIAVMAMGEFDRHIQHLMFQIVSLDSYFDMYRISKINGNLMPFVATKENDLLVADYAVFAKKVKDFTDYVFSDEKPIE